MILLKGFVMSKSETNRHFRLINGLKKRKNNSKQSVLNTKQGSQKYKTILSCFSLSKSIQKLSRQGKTSTKSGKIEKRHKSPQNSLNISVPLPYSLTKHLTSLRSKDIAKISRLQEKNLSVGWNLI